MAWIPTTPYNALPAPPLTLDLRNLWAELAEAHRYLGELKGACLRLPNPELLLSTMVFQESIDSSAIENIVTTQDALYKSLITDHAKMAPQIREVISYRDATYAGWEYWKSRPFISTNLAVHIYQHVKGTSGGLRTTPGTALRNAGSGEIIYTPPEWQLVPEKLKAWEDFCNAPQPIDPLVALAMQHYQFEAIHPFTDGNGRTGRVLNNLFLLTHGLLDLPILYLSRYIIRNRTDYYHLLIGVTRESAWEPWISYILRGISETARFTLNTIHEVLKLKTQTLQVMLGLSQKAAAHELNELIFTHPYLKTQVLIDKGIAKRTAASAYLHALVAAGVLVSRQEGREVYYIHQRLLDVLRLKG